MNFWVTFVPMSPCEMSLHAEVSLEEPGIKADQKTVFSDKIIVPKTLNTLTQTRTPYLQTCRF